MAAERCVGCGHNFYHDRPVRNMLCSYCIEEGGHRLWWFKIFRADGTAIDKGPYRSYEEAAGARREFLLCSPAFETDDQYRPQGE